MCTDWKIVCICFGLSALLEDPKRTTREYNLMKQKKNNTTPEKEGGKEEIKRRNAPMGSRSLVECQLENYADH